MSSIYEKIKAIAPDVTIEENGLSMIVVPSKEMPLVATYLSEKESFDSLVALIGNDWGESLGILADAADLTFVTLGEQISHIEHGQQRVFRKRSDIRR